MAPPAQRFVSDASIPRSNDVVRQEVGARQSRLAAPESRTALVLALRSPHSGMLDRALSRKHAVPAIVGEHLDRPEARAQQSVVR